MTRFPTTRWSLVRRARRESTSGSRAQMGQLLDSYWLPMYAHLRHKHLSAEQAEDLIQDFMVAILDKALFSIADPKRGKLRTLLLTALDRFVITQHRHDTAAKRSPDRITSLNQLRSDEISDPADSPAEAFDRAWCLDVLAQALARMQRECEASEQTLRWQVFERRVLGPLLDDAPQPSYRELAQQLGLPDEKAAMNRLVSAKRQFARQMRHVIRETITRRSSAVAGQAVSAMDSSDIESPDGKANEEEAAYDQLAELAVRQDVEREIDELRSILARTRSAATLTGEVPREAELADPLKSDYWMRLTQRHAREPTTVAHMFQLGTNVDDTQLSACFTDVLNTMLQDLPGLDYEGPGTLREFMQDPAPPIELLRRVKDWANVCRLGQDAMFPTPLANGIYFLVLALASAHSERITGLRDSELKAGYDWLLQQSWFERELRPLVRRAMDSMET